jgi:hypothetical protein
MGGDTTAAPDLLTKRSTAIPPDRRRTRRSMCILCTERATSGRQPYALHLLALLEEPDILPFEIALRLVREIWALTRAPEMTCDAVSAPEAASHG